MLPVVVLLAKAVAGGAALGAVNTAGRFVNDRHSEKQMREIVERANDLGYDDKTLASITMLMEEYPDQFVAIVEFSRSLTNMSSEEAKLAARTFVLSEMLEDVQGVDAKTIEALEEEVQRLHSSAEDYPHLRDDIPGFRNECDSSSSEAIDVNKSDEPTKPRINLGIDRIDTRLDLTYLGIDRVDTDTVSIDTGFDRIDTELDFTDTTKSDRETQWDSGDSSIDPPFDLGTLPQGDNLMLERDRNQKGTRDEQSSKLRQSNSPVPAESAFGAGFFANATSFRTTHTPIADDHATALQQIADVLGPLHDVTRTLSQTADAIESIHSSIDSSGVLRRLAEEWAVKVDHIGWGNAPSNVPLTGTESQFRLDFSAGHFSGEVETLAGIMADEQHFVNQVAAGVENYERVFVVVSPEGRSLAEQLITQKGLSNVTILSTVEETQAAVGTNSSAEYIFTAIGLGPAAQMALSTLLIWLAIRQSRRRFRREFHAIAESEGLGEFAAAVQGDRHPVYDRL
ncbi:hypothetical protein NDI76_19290 [Halogeometricum sp. S1BR25-6]|uniref:Uncharacterized protein n=1 Tax=Halogeometricum salsisoli TaxID=2950536 RepID=A0ABU2GKU0_9EURY|nr:hypothetical protein [Halogeometricum sp. S1BR25-6]MDS0300898.1 hypothetical protein [Halogeometricum sp. S1BR25-6]